MENYVHSISPVALQLYGDVAIRWYGLAYLAGLLLGLFLMKKMSQKGGNLLTSEQLSDLVTWSALGVMIGGRLGYCLFYSPSLLTDFGGSFPFWGVLKVWEGGMASHGGFIGVLISSYLFARKYKIDFLHVNDLTVLGGSLGFFFGRLANFINGELYGRVVEKPLSWAVKFPQEMTEWTGDASKMSALQGLFERFGPTRFAPQLAQQSWSELMASYSSNLEVRSSVNNFITWLQEQAVLKNQEVLTGLQNVLPARYPSQLIQAACEGLLVFILLNLIWLKPRKAGVITAYFGIFYAVARIFGEQFRKPDSHIGFQALGLTRGQWLSLGMLAAGVALLVFISLRNTQKIKGWSVYFKKN